MNWLFVSYYKTFFFLPEKKPDTPLGTLMVSHGVALNAHSSLGNSPE